MKKKILIFFAFSFLVISCEKSKESTLKQGDIFVDVKASGVNVGSMSMSNNEKTYTLTPLFEENYYSLDLDSNGTLLLENLIAKVSLETGSDFGSVQVVQVNDLNESFTIEVNGMEYVLSNFSGSDTKSSFNVKQVGDLNGGYDCDVHVNGTNNYINYSSFKPYFVEGQEIGGHPALKGVLKAGAVVAGLVAAYYGLYCGKKMRREADLCLQNGQCVELLQCGAICLKCPEAA
jgi:hypothetical protein